MAYCRFSTDDFACDVYVYADAGGTWTTHVAANKPTIDRAGLPPEPAWPADGATEAAVLAWAEAAAARQAALHRLLDGAERRPIGLPHDGATFEDATPGACADRLEALRRLGYVVPQAAIDELRAEEAEAGDVRLG